MKTRTTLKVGCGVESRTPVRKPFTQQGHTIMITLVVCLVLGVVLLGIIKLANNEGQMTGRSQNWNGVMPIVEAGIEEALTHLKYNPTNRASHGWTVDTSTSVPRYTRTRTFTDGYYKVFISTNWNPVIISRAGIRAPGQTEYSIFRAVRVTATNQPLFTGAMEGLSCIRLTGTKINFNSYDSRDPNFSGPGGTYDPTKTKAGGDVACYGGPNSLDIGNADIAGHIKTGPDTTYTTGPTASVGDSTWTQSGVQPGWAEEVPETEWPEMYPPPGSGTTPPPGTGDDRSYQYVLGTGFYETKTLNGDIKVIGDAKLVVTGDRMNLQGATITPGAKLKLYVFSKNASVSGVANQNTDALSFMYFGMPSNTDITMSGNSAFCGVLYAPSATLTLSGGGSDSVDFSGSIVAKCVIVNGKYSFHFDEALRGYGSRGIFAASWDEIYTDEL
jgi:hypothetical protein